MRRLNRNLLSRLLANNSGSIVPFVAAAVPAVAVLAVGASELALVSSDKAKLQDVADAVAMDAAQELAFSVDNAVVERAKVNAAQHLAALKDRRPEGEIVVTPTIEFNAKGDPEGMHVAIKATRKSFFGNMLPPGGFVTNVETSALRMGKAPLCILGTSKTISDTVYTQGTAKIFAGKCLVHSNHQMKGASTRPIETAAAEAVTSATGNIAPAPLVGAEAIDDPFSKIALWAPVGGCEDAHSFNAATNTLTVKKGLHCSKVMVKKGWTAVLEPGEHYFAKGGLDLNEQTKLIAHDAVLVYDKDSTLDLSATALVSVKGRQTGALAGFVLVATRDNTNGFTVNAGNIVEMLGTVYVPNARLTINGSGDMAKETAWTVVVGREVHVEGTANLFINANYRGSPVPVPKGVGNKSVDKTKNARLKR